MHTSKPIYLDYQATTPTDSRVLDAMLPFFSEDFANPHSSHFMSYKPAAAIEQAKAHIAELIGAFPEEIFFTSGATEANNQAIASVLLSNQSNKRKVLISSIEHKCVKEAAFFYANKLGFIVEEIPVDTAGRVDMGAYKKALTEDVLLVSIMAVNNEIGTVQDIKILAKLAHGVDALFHCDAAQASDSINIDVFDFEVDLLSLSAHKMYGPKGIGALFITSSLQPNLTAFIHGGGQQSGLRAGTLPTPLCVGFGEAAKISRSEFETNHNKLLDLRAKFFKKLKELNINFVINGAPHDRHPGNINIQLPSYDAESLLNSLQPYVCAATGSACNSGFISSSYVLSAIGLSAKEAASSIRFSLGRTTTHKQINLALNYLSQHLKIAQKLE